MSYAGVIVHVQAGPEGAGRLKCAREMADCFGATLIGVGAQAIPPTPFSDSYGAVTGDWVTAMRDTIDKELRDAWACPGRRRPAGRRAGKK